MHVILIIVVLIILAMLLFHNRPGVNHKWNKLIFDASPNGITDFRTGELLDNIANSDSRLEHTSSEDIYDWLYHDLITFIGLTNQELRKPTTHINQINAALTQLERYWPTYKHIGLKFPYRQKRLKQIKGHMIWNPPKYNPNNIWLRLIKLI